MLYGAVGQGLYEVCT